MSNAPVLTLAFPNLPLRLYLIVTKAAAGAMLPQEVNGQERAIYYLSKK